MTDDEANKKLATCWLCKTVWVFEEDFVWGKTCGNVMPDGTLCGNLLQPERREGSTN